MNTQVCNFKRYQILESRIELKFKGLLVVLVVFVGLGYFLYPMLKDSNQTVNGIIPETASVAIQVVNPKGSLSELESLSWFDAFDDIPLLSTLKTQLEKMNSLEKSQIVNSKISELSLWISLHTTASDDLTPLYILKSDGFDWNIASIQSIIGKLIGREISQKTQVFNGRDITIFSTNEFRLSVLIEGPFIAFSESTILVEDVVRAIQDPSSRLMMDDESFGELSDLSIVINTSRLSELRSVFFESDNLLMLSEPIKDNLMINLNLRDRSLSFNGSGKSNSLEFEAKVSSIFAEGFVPVSANSITWQPISIASEKWAEILSGDLCTIEVDRNVAIASQVFVFSTNDTSQLSRHVSELAEENLQASDSAVYRERFINSDIGFINDIQLLSSLLSTSSVEFNAPFYTIIQNVLIMSDDLDALKAVLSDFDNETTWGRSVERRPIIDDMIQETNLTIVKDFEFAADPLKNKLKPKWKTFFNESPELLSVLDVFKLQVNRTNKSFLVSGDVSFNTVFDSPKESIIDSNELTVRANVFADANLTTKPFVVRNHNDASREIVFQDAENHIYLTSSQGEVLWKREVGEQIRGDIHQVDFYNNKKLQYLFFTDFLVHLIDRNGSDVEGFPVQFSANLPIGGSSVIDYDNNKRYRYLTKDRRGNLYLFGKEGALLDGWNPKPIGGSLLQTPFHVRVRGRDCFVVVEKTGKIHLLNRRGVEYNGFPLNIEKSFAGDIAFVKGSNFEQSLISLSTTDGELIQVDLNGRVVLRKQLLRASATTEFSLVDDALKTTFSVVRNDGKALTIFDNKGTERFFVDFPNSKSIVINQYSFRNGKEIFAVRDLKRQVLRVIDREGKFLTADIPASSDASILFYQNRLEYEVFVNFANQLNIYAVKSLK
ncbi:MAG: hypothetical protein ACJAVN_001392 [Roseivirga sp.]